MLTPLLILLSCEMFLGDSGNDETGAKDGNDETGDVTETGDTEEEPEPEWSYSGETGPEHWGELSEEWSACGEGTQQSPVDITQADIELGSGTPPALSWSTTELNAYNPGYYLRYDVDPGSTMTVEGQQYDLVQFHFHGLSEHTVIGEHTDIEIHFVHTGKDDPTKLAVVAIFAGADAEDGVAGLFDEGGALRFREAIALPESHEPESLGTSVNLGEVFSFAEGSDALTYSGSLTTPPCTEGVQFYLVGTLLPMLPDDVAAFHALFDYNYRPTQPLNGRKLNMLSPATE